MLLLVDLHKNREVKIEEERANTEYWREVANNSMTYYRKLEEELMKRRKDLELDQNSTAMDWESTNTDLQKWNPANTDSRDNDELKRKLDKKTERVKALQEALRKYIDMQNIHNGVCPLKNPER